MSSESYYLEHSIAPGLGMSLKMWVNLSGHIVGKIGLPKVKAIKYQKVSWEKAIEIWL